MLNSFQGKSRSALKRSYQGHPAGLICSLYFKDPSSGLEDLSFIWQLTVWSGAVVSESCEQVSVEGMWAGPFLRSTRLCTRLWHQPTPSPLLSFLCPLFLNSFLSFLPCSLSSNNYQFNGEIIASVRCSSLGAIMAQVETSLDNNKRSYQWFLK